MNNIDKSLLKVTNTTPPPSLPLHQPPPPLHHLQHLYWNLFTYCYPLLFLQLLIFLHLFCNCENLQFRAPSSKYDPSEIKQMIPEEKSRGEGEDLHRCVPTPQPLQILHKLIRIWESRQKIPYLHLNHPKPPTQPTQCTQYGGQGRKFPIST